MKHKKVNWMKKNRWLLLFLPVFVLAGCEIDGYTYLSVDNNLPAAKYSYAVDGYTVDLKNESSNATSYLWDFGDGTTSTEKSPEHVYQAKGKYVITLTASDNNNKSDKYVEEAAIGFPYASFTYIADKLNVTFNNTSKNASSYLWDFGDGVTTEEDNPVHDFQEEGMYTVSLTAIDGTDENTYSESIYVYGKFIPVILNPSFEDGKEYWQEDGNNFNTSGSPAPPDGNKAAKCASVGNYIIQTFEVGEYTDYILRYFTVSKSKDKGGVITITDSDGHMLYDGDTGGTPDSKTYVERTVKFKTQGSTSVRLKVAYNGVEFRVDYFTID